MRAYDDVEAIEADALPHHIPIEADCFPDWFDSAKSTDPCVSCGGDDKEGLVLVCDKCDAPHHAHCVGFDGPVEADWLCPDCDDPAPKRPAKRPRTRPCGFCDYHGPCHECGIARGDDLFAAAGNCASM